LPVDYKSPCKCKQIQQKTLSVGGSDKGILGRWEPNCGVRRYLFVSVLLGDVILAVPQHRDDDVVALRASIDASRLGTGVFSLGGVAFGYDRAVKANAEWERLMKGRTFHMTDLNARKGDFKGISDADKQEIMVGIVSIIKRHASCMVAVSCNDSNISEAFPAATSGDRNSEEMRNAFRSAYGVMCNLCLSALGRMQEEKTSKKGKSISYIFEAGDKGQPGMLRFINFMMDLPAAERLAESYSMAWFTIATKGQMEGIFHAADFVAWEWSRHVERQLQGKVMRKSLSVLTGETAATPDYFGLTLGSRTKSYFFRHFDNRHIDRFVRSLRELIEARTPGEVDSAEAQWAATRFP
jgi:hypothetical protein